MQPFLLITSRGIAALTLGRATARAQQQQQQRERDQEERQTAAEDSAPASAAWRDGQHPPQPPFSPAQFWGAGDAPKRPVRAPRRAAALQRFSLPANCVLMLR